ncbi:MAG: translation initiation factor IF-2 N-terminal domain-containing protein, partial [bacterium]
MTGHLKVRLYDLAKELKLDTKRLIEEVRREGVDVSVPSNSVSKELADKIRNKYFPKKEAAVKRVVRVVKKAARPVVEEAPRADEEEIQPEPEPEITYAAPAEPAASVVAPAKPGATRLVKKLAPATRAEQPGATVVEPVPAEVEIDQIEADATPT